MSIILRMICYFVIVLLICYSLLRYYHLWSRNNLPNTAYFVLQIVFLICLVICQRKASLLPGGIFGSIFQGISAVYFSIMVFTPILCFIRGVIRIAGGRMKKHGKIYRFFNHPARSIYCFLVLTAMFGGFAFFQMRHLVTTEYQISLAKTSDDESMNIALISDVHLGSGVTENGLVKLIEKTNACNPDLILLCGDIIDNNTSAGLRSACAKHLKSFKAKYGVFYIEGNKEALINHYEKLFEESNVKFLEDQTIYLANGVQLIGLRDQSNKDKLPVEQVLLGMDSEKPIIVASHRPVDLDKLAGAGTDLVLCGHTIGGQYPLGNFYARLSNDMVYGQKKFDKMNAITTSGAGGYGVPVKFISKSEIALVHVTFTKPTD